MDGSPGPGLASPPWWRQPRRCRSGSAYCASKPLRSALARALRSRTENSQMPANAIAIENSAGLSSAIGAVPRSHHEVKAKFVDLGAYNVTWKDGLSWVFIPARVQDNPALLQADPRYIDRLKSTGSPQRVRAWLEGDWNVIEGAFFSEFMARHVITPFTVPAHWTKFRSMDWGSALPCIAGGRSGQLRTRWLHLSALFVYRSGMKQVHRTSA